MSWLNPIPEVDADSETLKIYQSIKQTLGLQNVPIIFQYLAVFPKYLAFIWQQAQHNLNDSEFINQAKKIENFAQTAIQTVYTPSALTQIFLEKLKDRAEKAELIKFVATISQMNSSLYLLSLAIRESLKGKYLGIKQIGERLVDEEKTVFNDLSEGFLQPVGSNKEGKSNVRIHATKGLTYQSPTGITTSLFAEFFNVIEKEMDKLRKEEKYLIRRVELERFALSCLHLIPHPLDSSITTIFKQAYNHPQFPELIYLIADLFPTQAPYKLLSSAVMKKALSYKREDAISITITVPRVPNAD